MVGGRRKWLFLSEDCQTPFTVATLELRGRGFVEHRIQKYQFMDVAVFSEEPGLTRAQKERVTYMRCTICSRYSSA